MPPGAEDALAAGDGGRVGLDGWQHGFIASDEVVFAEEKIVIAMRPSGHIALARILPQRLHIGCFRGNFVGALAQDFEILWPACGEQSKFVGVQFVVLFGIFCQNH